MLTCFEKHQCKSANHCSQCRETLDLSVVSKLSAASGHTDCLSWTHVSEKTATDGQRGVCARLQLLQEVLTVEVPEFLHIPENDAALPPQVLGQVQALHLGEIVLDDVAERADILSLCGDHLVHDVLHFTGEHKDTIRCKSEP